MRIALIGARGQLGSDLREVLDGDVVALGHEEIEISDSESVRAALDRAGPDAVINAAAYNLVDRAEDEPAAAFAVNALGPRNLAIWCARADVPLMHFSTDYVFSGRLASGTYGTASSRQPLMETDLPDPQSAYAVSKLAGEHFVSATCRRHFVLRTCGLYGRRKSAGKGNFIETMRRLGAERVRTGEPLRVVDDHLCTPTFTEDLAAAAAALIRTEAWGLYHATNAGETTWRRLAEEIFRQQGMAVKVVPIRAAEFGAKASRPEYSVLNGTRLTAVLGRPLPHWTEALMRYLNPP